MPIRFPLFVPLETYAEPLQHMMQPTINVCSSGPVFVAIRFKRGDNVAGPMVTFAYGRFSEMRDLKCLEQSGEDTDKVVPNK